MLTEKYLTDVKPVKYFSMKIVTAYRIGRLVAYYMYSCNQLFSVVMILGNKCEISTGILSIKFTEKRNKDFVLLLFSK